MLLSVLPLRRSAVTGRSPAGRTENQNKQMKLQCEQRKSHCLMGQLETFNATKCKVRSQRQGRELHMMVLIIDD